MLAVTDIMEVSPLKNNRKRSRDVAVNEDSTTVPAEIVDAEMETNDNLKSISGLSIDELKIAQQIAIEHLKNSLFITIELTKPKTNDNPFLETVNEDTMDVALSTTIFDSPRIKPYIFNTSAQFSPTSTSLALSPTQNPFGPSSLGLCSVNESPMSPHQRQARFLSCSSIPSKPKVYGSEADFFAPLLKSVCELFLNQTNSTPSLISTSLKMTERSKEIKDMFLINNTKCLTMGPSDTTEIARVIIYILERTPSVLPINLKVACLGILAINQATTTSRKVGKTNIKFPNALVKSLVRYMQLILEM
jgi:hypothetical protein